MSRFVIITRRDIIIALIMYLVSLAPIYVFLFSNGYLNFYNYNLPLFSGKEVEYLLTASVYNPETGLAVNDGILYLYLTVFTALGIYNIIILDKIFLLVTFSVTFLLLWAMINKAIEIFGITKYKNLLRIIGVLFFILNPVYLEYITYNFFNSIWGVIVFSYAVLKFLDIVINNKSVNKYDIMKSGVALGFGGLMDPRIYVWGLYIMVLIFIISITIKRGVILKSIKYLSLSYILSLPILIYVYYIFIYTSLITQPSLSKAVSVQAYRPDTYSYIATWSGNSHIFNVFAFINTGWTSIVYAPPSILLYPRHDWWFLPYFGDHSLILLPPDVITYIWLASLYIFITVATLALFDKKRLPISALLFTPMFIILSISAGTNVPIKTFVYLFEIDPSKLPIIGGIFGTTFAIPYDAEIMTLPLASYLSILGVNYILEKVNKEITKKTLVLVIIVLAVFASWQYFNGTLYPSQVTGSFPGNSISLEGYYYPLNPPPQWVHVMNTLSTSTAGVVYVGEIGFSEKWAHYQFISLSPPLMPGYVTISPPQTNYVNQAPLAYDIAGVKYLFIDDTSYIPISNSFIYSYLNDSGLKVIYAKGDVYLLEQPNSSVFREAKMGIYFDCKTETVLFKAEWLLYPLLNYTPAIISPVKTSNTITMVLNPSTVSEDYMSLYNGTRNVTILSGNYIIDDEGNITHLAVISKENVTVKPWTMIIPENVSLTELVSIPINFSFNQLMAEFTAYSNSGYLVETSLPLPYGGIEVSNGKALGVNGFGQYIFSSSGILTISIKLGFVTNVLMTAVDIFFYALFIYFILYKNVLSKGIEVLRNDVIRISGLKGNK
ncbi:hypothetical protein [Stygiolobus caldivivus]|uniref:Uncharacterized protein n=1 Tax=Stygiolobus caldivivus TaxID=2824673 RepID=A0A8D5U4F4_9CREN|nr:hypothetical protein [Stygiolobus caldivivus]BCU68769.1 hypothetical protein KN1_00660 [Stygiolobus caldivivus]